MAVVDPFSTSTVQVLQTEDEDENEKETTTTTITTTTATSKPNSEDDHPVEKTDSMSSLSGVCFFFYSYYCFVVTCQVWGPHV